MINIFALFKLEEVGSKWWPEEVKREAEEMSILQYLLDTQSKFISLPICRQNRYCPNLSLIEASKFGWHLCF